MFELIIYNREPFRIIKRFAVSNPAGLLPDNPDSSRYVPTWDEEVLFKGDTGYLVRELAQ